MSAAVLRDVGFRRYLTTSALNTGGFTAALDGGKVISWSAALAARTPIIPVGRGLCVRMKFFGAGADNATFDYRIWALSRLIGLPFDYAGDPRDVEMDEPAQYALDFLGSGTATLSTATGIAGGRAVLAAERLADTLTFTASTTATAPKGPLATGQTAYAEGAAGVYSPADNTPALLLLPHIMRSAGIVIDINSGAAVSGNALVSISAV